MKKILFICTANRFRSRTAHELFENTPGLDVKSCGMVSFYVNDTIKFYWPRAQHFSQELYDWADLVFVMENYHLNLLSQKGINWVKDNKIINLGIEDVYEYNDPDLVRILKERVTQWI